MHYYNPSFNFHQINPTYLLQNHQKRTRNGLNLTWEDVCVDYKQFFVKKNNKRILKNQYGKITNGELVALLGASGSGKTTLLNALSFRKVRNLSVSGSIKVNGVEMSREKMLSISSFVQQEDIFVGTLTVREHLMFHAILRMGRSLSNQEKEAKVEKLMHDLMLVKCQNSVIGVPGKLKGISGGEKKRLSFATETLNDPMLLFCDEPTSGLDSSMAYSVVESLKNIAKSGKTVLTTIHQPSTEVFLMFDYIYVLYDGYLALAGTRDVVTNFLSSLNFKSPQDYNPADFILETLSLKANTFQQDMMKASMITQSFQRSPLYSTLLQQVTSIAASNHQQEMILRETVKQRNRNHSSFLVETTQIFKRNAINFLRDRSMIFMRLLQIIIYSLLVGITFLQLKVNPTESVVINKVIFLQILSVSLVGSLSAITFYPQEFPILYKENESKTYRIVSYFLGNILFEIPLYVFLTIIFTSINYWLVGLNPRAECFFISLGWLSIASIASVSFGHLLATFAPSPYSAVILFMPGLLGMTMMTTFWLYNAESPIDFLKYMSWIHYCFELQLINQWSTLKSTTDCPNCGDSFLAAFGAYTSIIYVFIIGLVASCFVWVAMAYVVTVIRLKVLFG